MNKYLQVGLESANVKMIEKVEKAVWHSHAGKGGNITFIESQVGTVLPRRNIPFKSMQEMHHWITKEYGFFANTVEGMMMCWEACFAEACRDNYKTMVQSFSFESVFAVGGMRNFINIIEQFKAKYCPELSFLPELRLNRGKEEISLISLDEVLSFDYFKSLDLCGDEQGMPIECFVPAFRLAEKYKLRLAAHIGEQITTTPQEMVKAIETLHLQSVYHGIVAAKSIDVMNWLRENNIILHICPTSNIMLSRVSDYSNHPIRTFVDYGVQITVNTDDLLVFNSSLSEEYLKLYTNNILSAYEIDNIIDFSLHLEGR